MPEPETQASHRVVNGHQFHNVMQNTQRCARLAPGGGGAALTDDVFE
jgi:hypothetical protein